ncbi:MAG: 3-oxoacyl-[acyl-carrier-protein] synthase III C-terminal domain-containing protein [Gammaproteobacteria bacterium]
MNSFDILEIQSSIGEIETSPALLFDDDDGRIAEKTGIKTIHRSDYSAYDLAIKASCKLKSLPDVRDEIKYLIYVTQSPSFYLPNHASRLQNELDITKSSMCFDINQGCSGFVQALVAMNSLLNDSQDLGLIVCADTYSHHLSAEDRSTQVLFSDGATATLIKGGGKWQIKASSHLTDGSGADMLVKNTEASTSLVMDGASVFQWTRRELGKQIKNLLNINNFNIEQIDGFYLHQASKLVLTNVLKSLGVDNNLAPTSLHLTGNLVSSSIPFLLENNLDLFNNSKHLIMSGFGVGLSCSTCLLKNKNAT